MQVRNPTTREWMELDCNNIEQVCTWMRLYCKEVKGGAQRADERFAIGVYQIYQAIRQSSARHVQGECEALAAAILHFIGAGELSDINMDRVFAYPKWMTYGNLLSVSKKTNWTGELSFAVLHYLTGAQQMLVYNSPMTPQGVRKNSRYDKDKLEAHLTFLICVLARTLRFKLIEPAFERAIKQLDENEWKAK